MKRGFRHSNLKQSRTFFKLVHDLLAVEQGIRNATQEVSTHESTGDLERGVGQIRRI